MKRNPTLDAIAGTFKQFVIRRYRLFIVGPYAENRHELQSKNLHGGRPIIVRPYADTGLTVEKPLHIRGGFAF